MAEESVLSDDLLRQLVAVGHVDVLVGVPTLNNAATIARVVKAVQVGLATYYPRARTVLINSDGGSDDGTPAIVNDCCEDGQAVTASHSLRTAHRISTPFQGVPGKGSALRSIFAAADLLSAGAVAVVDPDVTSISPEWIASLLRPVTGEGVDLVVPVHPRAPSDSPLVTQLVRPLVRAAYGWRVQQPLIEEFGCSGRFAAHCVELAVWDRKFSRDAAAVWLVGEALSTEFRVAQAALGARVVAAGRYRLGLPELFQQFVGATFESLEMHASYWLSRTASEPVPLFGTPAESPPPSPAPDAVQMARVFANDVADLHPVLASILSPDTLAGVSEASQGGATLRYSDDLWAATVYEVLLAHFRAVIKREHVIQALLPLYLGRTASFLIEHASSDAASIDHALERLCLAFEQLKPRAAEAWNQTA